MASKPSSKPAWVPSDDPAKIIEPSVSKKNTGWAQEEKPPFQYFNWFWNNLSKWVNFFSGQQKYNIIIDSDTDEGDFTTLASYLAGSPTSGDRVLLRVDETITATLSIPAGVLVHQQKGKSITTSTVFTPVLQLGNNSVLEGDFKLNTSHTGTIADGVSFNGDGARVDNLIIENTTSGTVTDAVQIESGKKNNLAEIQINNTGAGSITNNLNNASGNVTNRVIIRTDTGTDSTSAINISKIQPVDASVAANALTLTLNKTTLDFRDATLGSGIVNTRDIPAAISLVIPSGATLGTVNGLENTLAVVTIDTAGILELAVVNLAGGNDLSETGIISTTAIDATADLDNVFYSDTARANVPYRVVGFAKSTQAVAGTWATAPSLVQGAGGNALSSLEETLVASHEVSGGAVTNIDFTGLDINKDETYRIEFEIENATALLSTIYMFVDNAGVLDTTAANYWAQSIFVSGAVSTPGRSNLPTVSVLDAILGHGSTGNILLHKLGPLTGNGRPMAESYFTRSHGSSINQQSITWSKGADVDNITKLRFSSTVAGAIANGSRIRIYKNKRS